jgi:hypothetical protein
MPTARAVTEARTERLSATMSAAKPRRSGAVAAQPGKAATVNAVAGLTGLYTWVVQGIEQWADEGDPRVKAEIKPNSRMSAEDRFAIYSRDYYGRLREVLQQDYSAFAHAIGEKHWRVFVDRYLLAHPPRDHNLNTYGVEFADFVAASRLPKKAALADLCRLERAIAQATLHEDKPALQKDALGSLAPEEWDRCQLEIRPAVKTLELAWPMNSYLSAWADGHAQELPVRPRRQWVQVYPVEGRTFRLSLSKPRYLLLDALREGKTLGEALVSTYMACRGRGISTEQIQEWFADWMGDGVFCGLTRKK